MLFTMKLRKATSQDAVLLSSLNVDVQRLHAEHHPNMFKMPESDDFAAPFFDLLLADTDTSIFVAEQDGEALGYVVCRVMERPENVFSFPSRYLLVDQISVRPEARKRGVGAALIEQARRFAEERSLPRIHLDSWAFNVDAHAFFEGQGFEKMAYRYWLDVEE
jgi:ribosomal protein S18 acetylase RimI-like enzyme